MVTQDLIKKAAERYGYNLEFKAKKILEELNFRTDLNRTSTLDQELIETDIIAIGGFNNDLHLIIECKGIAQGSCLLLIKETKKYEHVSEGKTRFDIDNSKYKIPLYKSTEEIQYTFTGDFFINNTKELKKISKDDSQNNFYKAQQQIINSILAYSRIPEVNEPTDYIVPLIVTNAEIWIIDYNQDKPICQNYQWVLHRLITTKFSSSFNFIPIQIVNINHLSDFLTTLKKSQNTNPKWGISNVIVIG